MIGRHRHGAPLAVAASVLLLALMAPLAPGAAGFQLGADGALPPGVAGLNQESITGQIDMLLLRFDYPDARYSQSEAEQDALWAAGFDHLDWYYQRQSNGKIIGIAWEHPGYFDLGVAHSEITGLFDIRARARAKSIELFDIDPDSFDVVVYAMPGGLSIPGANGGGFGNTGNIWLPQTSEAGIREGLVHEMGHAFSLGHSAASTSADAGAVLPSTTFRGGSDPYGMMGSGQNSFKADWPLPMRHSRGWIDNDQFVDCSGNGVVRIYTSFAERLAPGRTVGCRTILHDAAQGDRREDVWFSYAPSDDGAAGFSENFGIDPSYNLTGLMMHGIAGSVEPVMIDLTPGSQVSDFRLQVYVDTMDGTVRPGESVTIDDGARPVTITNLGAGGVGDDRWIDVAFDWADGGPPPPPTPTPVPVGDVEVVVDGFAGEIGGALDGVGGGRGFVENWRIVGNGDVATIAAGSLSYGELVETGESLQVAHVMEDSGNAFLAERTLQRPISAGDVWMSYRLNASAVGNGHLFVAPTQSGDSSIGKAWGSSFSIHNDRSAHAVQTNTTHLLVARYQLDPDGLDRIDLWIDPLLDQEPSAETAVVTKVAEIGSVDMLRLNVQDYGQGQYRFDEFRLGTSWAQMVRDAANPFAAPTPVPTVTPAPTATPTPVPTPPAADLVHTVSCLAENGRADTTIVNRGSSAAIYRLEFAGLSPRQTVVEPGDWARMPITGRADGDYLVRVLRNGSEISTETLTVDCDSPTPTISSDEVVITSACRNGFGYVLFQFLNDAPVASGYVIAFEGVPNRSTSAMGYGQSVRAVTGRPSGDHAVTIRRDGQVMFNGDVTVDC